MSTPVTPNYPPVRVGPPVVRRRTAIVWVALAVILALLLGHWLWPRSAEPYVPADATSAVATARSSATTSTTSSTPSSSSTTSASPTSTASPSETPTSASASASPTNSPSAALLPAVAGVNADCPAAKPVLPKHWLGQTMRLPATADAAYAPLPDFQKAGADAMAYMGAHVDVKAAGNWIGSVWCNSMTPMFNPDPVFNELGLDGGKAYLQELLKARPGLIGMWVIEQAHVNPATDAKTTNARYAALAPLGIKVLVIHDQHSANSAENLALAKEYQADVNVTGYYPFTGSKKYGDESTLPMDARTAVAINGDTATGAVQAFDWWDSDPATALTMGFARTDIRSEDVVRMGRSQFAAGTKSLLIVGLEPKNDKVPFVVECLRGVRFLMDH